MMNIKKLFKSIIPALCLCLCMCVLPAYADESVGSINVTIKAYATDETVGGGSLDLYRIADVSGVEFIYTNAFDGCDAALLTQDKLDQADTAETFKAWIADNKIEPDTSVEVNNDGEAVFDDLPLGLYLIAQNTAADGYTAINAFLVTVPMTEDGAYVYDVSATPKTAPVEKIEDDDKETPVIIDKESPEIIDTDISSGSAPQTGDNWYMLGALIAGIAGLFGCIYLTWNRKKEGGNA